MPLCRDCEHCAPDQDARDPFDWARCERLTSPDLVRGGDKPGFCDVERAPLGRCGPEGKFFLPLLEDRDATLGATALGG